MVPCFLIAAHPEPLDKEGTLKVDTDRYENSYQSPYDLLPSDQQQVYHQLGPLYQKIYLYAFNPEERHRVVVYVRKGISYFEAMNIILRAEERKYAAQEGSPPNKSIAPSDRQLKGSCQSRGIF